ncbi:MAG: metallophosphoesterase [Verrucomicrobiota bacterium]
MQPRPPLEIQPLEENLKGRDFIVGDLHGCADELMRLLEEAKFDLEKDRLFCVGDLGDRGPSSLECCNLLQEPWFHLTLGNHDEVLMYAICSAFPAPSDRERWLDCAENYEAYLEILERNSGQWAVKMLQQRDERLIPIAQKLLQAPLIITVGKPPLRFNVVHSGFVREGYGITDEIIDQAAFDDPYEWSEYLLQSRWLAKLPEVEHPVYAPDLSRTYCGHTPVFRPVKVYSHYCIDTGSGHTPESKKPLRMTLVDHRAEKIYSVDTRARKPAAWQVWLKSAVIRVESMKDAALNKPTTRRAE